VSLSDDLEGLRTVERADVYQRGAWAATLTRTANGVEFCYLDEWVSGGRPPIATSLPVSAEPLLRPAGAVPAYFEGLLPEGRRLGALRRTVKTSADDELSLLLAVGGDAVGNVQVLPEGVVPGAVAPRLSVAGFDEVRFADLLSDAGIRVDRVGLPGIQDKASAAMLNVPVSRAGEAFFLKLNPPELPHLVENETFFLRAARLSGLSAAEATVVHDIDGEPGLLVRRFDRLTVDGQPWSLAVEDACQVLGRPPADKYLVGTEAALGALAAVCGAPVVAARELIRQLGFAYLTGNGDAHAKNFSVLEAEDREWRPSPAYDLPSSQPYGDTTLALSLGGGVTGDVGARDFVALGSTLGVPDRAVRRLLTDLTERVDLWLVDLADLPFDRRRIEKLRRVVMYRRRRLGQ
jgi:serine/threonine-protein kinase HipA